MATSASFFISTARVLLTTRRGSVALIPELRVLALGRSRRLSHSPAHHVPDQREWQSQRYPPVLRIFIDENTDRHDGRYTENDCPICA